MKPRPVSVFEPAVSYAAATQLNLNSFPPLAAPKGRKFGNDARNTAAHNTPNKRLRTDDVDRVNADKNNTSIDSQSTISAEDLSASGGQISRTPSFVNNVHFEEIVSSQTNHSEAMIVDTREVSAPYNTPIAINNSTALITFEKTNAHASAANISTMPLSGSPLLPPNKQK